MQRGLIFMGTNKVTMVRVGFLANAPLTNNDISPAQKATLQSMANVAAMAGANALWDMSSATGAGVDPWYQSGAGMVYPDRWAAAMEACQRYYNKKMWMVEPFNEPDFGWGQGSQQNLYNIIGYLQASTNFLGTIMAGGSTLNDDNALSWFNAISSRATMGPTVIGAGTRGTALARHAAAQGAAVAAVAEPDRGRREAFAREFALPAADVLASWEAMEGRDLGCDAAIITTLDNQHTGPALACLRRGWHLLLEKPMAATLEDCLAIEAASAGPAWCCRCAIPCAIWTATGPSRP